MLPYDTHSLCKYCYRHIPATVYEEDGEILITKTCPEHGEETRVVEADAEFYKSLEYIRGGQYDWNAVLVEVTDRCNLNCPHCYHLPDNKIIDRPIFQIIDQIKALPKEVGTILLAGAEPTLRKDLPELVAEVEALGKFVQILTNGIKLADEDFVKAIKAAGNPMIALGLNHPEYQGEVVHRKQLTGLINCYKNGLALEYVGYTCETYEQLDFILDEIQSLHKVCQMIRIRFGSDIGRAPDEPKRTLSDNYKKLVEVANKKGYDVKRLGGDDNIYHIMLQVGNAKVRLIQWPDVENIVMEELKTGPWCDFYDGPVTNFVHQVIMRDAFKNKKQPRLDTCPDEYHYRYFPDACKK